MSSAASLSLLKGGKKSSIDEELEKAPAPKEEDDDDTVVIDVDVLSSKELDELVDEHGIGVPGIWPDMSVGEKRSWLKEQFEDDETEQVETADEIANALVEVEEAGAAEEAAEAVAKTDAQAEAQDLKPKGKGKAKTSKSKAVANAPKSGEIEKPGDDVISDLVHEIENMKEQEARAAVALLTNETEMTLFKLGGVLHVIQANKWHEPYVLFKDYVETEIGINYRKALYWIAIYKSLVESKVPWEKVKHLGWTKVKEIAEILTLDNVDEWVEVAGAQTTLQLIETVKAYKNKDNPKALEDQSSKTITTKTFKVHADQKETIEAAIDKAKEQSGTTVDTAALEFICLDFLGGQTMSQRLQKMGLDAALEALEKAYPTTSITVELNE